MLIISVVLLFAALAVDLDSIPTCRSLREKTSRMRWLCVPDSRLVLNPGEINDPPAPAVPREIAQAVPVNLAYYVGRHPARLPFFMAWQNELRPLEVQGPSLDFSASDAGSWPVENLSADFGGNTLRMAVGDAAGYGSLTREVTVDLDETPCLVLRVAPSEGANWAVKLDTEDAGSQVFTVVRDTSRSGEFGIDIQSPTGWQGRKTFQIHLFVVGKAGTSVEYSDVRFVGARGLSVDQIVWSPDQISVRAEADQLLTSLETVTCFADESTLAQLVRVVRSESGKWVLMGQFPDGEVAWDSSRCLLILQGKEFHAVIAFSRAAKWAGDGFAPGVWAVEFDGVADGDEIAIAARFAVGKDGIDDTAAQAQRAASVQAFNEALERREKDWDSRLSRVPRPMSFELRMLDRKDATPDLLWRTYYKAWVFLLSDTLPTTPENNYHYPQITVGKPSLWADGHPNAGPACQWESFIAMQFVAEMEPTLMWDSYEGMLSLVDENGTFAGEGLPSRHAQTAWILYSTTRDADRLRRAYPDLKRLLLWKIADPRWIYKNQTAEGSKDSEFVVHALLDMVYTKRICDVLEMPDEKSFWQNEIEKLRASYVQWFWETPGGVPYRFFNEVTGERRKPDDSWNMQALVLPPDVLGEQERESLLKSLRGHFDENIPFLVYFLNKFPSSNFTIRGVWQYGRPEEVVKMTEAALSTVALADEFSECYSDKFPVTCWGVIPSVFGTTSAIDSALWLNGVFIGDGLPILARTPCAVGVENLTVRGETMSVRYDAGEGVELQGAALRLLRLPDGFESSVTADGALRWVGKLAVGDQIILESV